MSNREIKEEARKKLALNMHQAIIVYTVEYTIFVTLMALIVVSCVALGSINLIAAIVMVCYGAALLVIAFIGSGMINFAMSDFYLVSYKCKAYDIRRLGETIAHCNIPKVLQINVKRMFWAFLLLLCLIVPGIIYLIRTSMANYLLIANPKMKPSTALAASSKVMSSKTVGYFMLGFSMLGWYLLGIMTLGLGFIFIGAYTKQVKAVFYKRVLQGDKNTYIMSEQPLEMAAPGNAYVAAPTRPAVAEQQTAAYVQPQQVSGEGTPIDTLEDADVLDMNAAMQDFGEQNGFSSARGGMGNNGFDSVAEVPLTPPSVKAENRSKMKMTREEKRQAKVAEARKIDGTGIVETERTLTTQELNDSDEVNRRKIERMYGNPDYQRSNINYFSRDAENSTQNDFVDDFGVSDVDDGADAQVVIEPVIADDFAVDDVAAASDPVMSDAAFDEFLRKFDGNANDVAANNEAAQPVPFVSPLKPNENANTDNAAAARRKEAEERLALERKSAAERLAQARQAGVRPDLSDRAERLRREREQRLQNQPPRR